MLTKEQTASPSLGAFYRQIDGKIYQLKSVRSFEGEKYRSVQMFDVLSGEARNFDAYDFKYCFTVMSEEESKTIKVLYGEKWYSSS